MTRIFLSYSRVDKQFVEALAEKLRRLYGYDNIWFDEGLHGGDIWWEEILAQIAQRDIFIYVLSNDSVQSDYCQAEFSEARRLQKQIITVQARDRTRLTDALSDIHYINMAMGVDDADAITELYSAVNKRTKLIPKRPPKPLWEPATPKPNKVDESVRPQNAPDVDTPRLELPPEEMNGKPPQAKTGLSSDTKHMKVQDTHIEPVLPQEEEIDCEDDEEFIENLADDLVRALLSIQEDGFEIGYGKFTIWIDRDDDWSAFQFFGEVDHKPYNHQVKPRPIEPDVLKDLGDYDDWTIFGLEQSAWEEAEKPIREQNRKKLITSYGWDRATLRKTWSMTKNSSQLRRIAEELIETQHDVFHVCEDSVKTWPRD